MERALPDLGVPTRGVWRDVVLPKEHGSWSLAFEPIVFGLVAAPSAGGAWLALAVAGAFFARRPLRLGWSKESGERRAAARAMLALCAAAIALGLGLATAQGGLGWLGWLVPSALCGAVFVAFDVRRDGRAAVAEVAGAVAFALVPAALAALAGRAPETCIALAVLMVGRAAPTVLTVRAALRMAKTGEPKIAPALGCAGAALASAAFCAAVGWTRWPAVAGLAVLAGRSFGLLVFPRPILRARTIGLIEAVLGLAYVLGVGLVARS